MERFKREFASQIEQGRQDYANGFTGRRYVNHDDRRFYEAWWMGFSEAMAHD